MDRMKLIFLHIPKAGGTTLESILKRKQFPGTSVRLGKATSVQEFRDWPEERRRRVTLVTGHFGFGLHEALGSGDIKYLTVFRDPVERAISHYHYVKRHPSHWLHREVVGNSMSLKEFISTRVTTQLDNGQVRLIAGCEDPGVRVSGDLVDDAIANLQRWFISFGILERFDESLILFKKRLGWSDYPGYRKKNTGDDKESVSQDDRNAIRECNRYDEALYSWASRAFDDQLGRIKGLGSELHVLGAANAAYAEGLREGYESGRAAAVARSPLRRLRRKLGSAFPKPGLFRRR